MKRTITFEISDRTFLYIMYFACIGALTLGGHIIIYSLMAIMEPLSAFIITILWALFWIRNGIAVAMELGG